MGTLHYGTADTGIEIDDETLAHVAAVTVAKLRRHEPFLLTCASESGREAIWMHTASTVRFAYSTGAQITLDKVRLEAMVRDTNRLSGFTVAGSASVGTVAIESLGVAA